MSTTDQQASNSESLRRVVIDPVSRVEGHGKVTLLLDENNHVAQARLHIVEFRGFERFIRGRPYWELPVLVQRLCGICPVSHHLAAAKAIDQLVGVDQLTPSAEKLRKLLHFGQVLQSHALHFFYLASPDLLFGFSSDKSKRNILGLLADYPELSMQGIKLRKFGQEVIRIVTGKRIHGTGAIAGGMNKSLTPDEVNYLLNDIDDVIEWSKAAVKLAADIHLADVPFNNEFATIKSGFMGLTGSSGELELYHGGLRGIDRNGHPVFDHFDYRHYHQVIHEEVKPWTYMKFPFFESLGVDDGWYRVGPLARVNLCDLITTPAAEQARVAFKAQAGGDAMGMVQSSLAFHWARMIEILHCAESIKALLHDADLQGKDLVVTGEKRLEGIGVIEAPRGTLFHHYEINEDDIVTKANLIVSTTSNNQAMNESVRQVAARYLDGQELTEGLLNYIEVAIRAYDPCLSCATHALGKMPLQVELRDVEGKLLQQLVKNSQGEVSG
ncbi:Ni/Fe hydrogenase subunit alpha [Cycloclasticus pugetii]|uniref:Ni/Fe hydrogenase subunit alpha n=1 Tax=Cycloclasticus pugetii TaxID=34068 RepID=UPI00037C01FC|nr:Ni/Fe hydrogenase subunit alpha [Cycloclasticus pugetii]